MYFSIHVLKHVCSFPLKLLPGSCTQCSKQLLLIFCIRILAFARFDWAVRYCFTLSGVLEGADAKLGGRLMVSVAVGDDELLLLSEEEPPPKKPPKAMLSIDR